MKLSEAELKRYNWQMLMNGWGKEILKELKASTVFIAGAGSLGSSVSIYLAAVGVGNIRIYDFDSVDLTNFNRQRQHDDTRISMNKATSGKTTLERVNLEISITALCDKIADEKVDSLVGDADIIIDFMDNFPTRYLLNNCAIR